MLHTKIHYPQAMFKAGTRKSNHAAEWILYKSIHVFMHPWQIYWCNTHLKSHTIFYTSHNMTQIWKSQTHTCHDVPFQNMVIVQEQYDTIRIRVPPLHHRVPNQHGTDPCEVATSNELPNLLVLIICHYLWHKSKNPCLWSAFNWTAQGFHSTESRVKWFKSHSSLTKRGIVKWTP